MRRLKARRRINVFFRLLTYRRVEQEAARRWGSSGGSGANVGSERLTSRSD